MDQLIVHVTGRTCDIQVSNDGRMQQAHYEAAHIGMSGPEVGAMLRWEGDPTRSTLQLHLSEGPRLRGVGAADCREAAPGAVPIVDPVFQQVVLALFDALRSEAPGLYAETVAEFLMAHVLLRHTRFVPPAPLSPARQRLQRVDTFMRAHLEEPLSLEVIAREAGLSRFHTLRLFKSAFGETPLKRLARLRMERARSCLAAGNEPVTEIAFGCGYENSAHFASAFRRWTGLSPSEYRARCKALTTPP